MEETLVPLPSERRLIVSDTSPQITPPAQSIYRKLYDILSRYTALILFSCIVVGVCSVLESLLPYHFAKLTHSINGGQLLYLFGLVLLCCLMIVLRKYVCDVTKEMVLLSLRGYCFSRFMQNDLKFFQKNSTSVLLNLILSDVKAVRTTLTKTIFKLSKNLSGFTTVVVLMSFMNGWLTLVLLAGLPISVYLNYMLTKKLKQHSKLYNAAANQSFSFALESFRGIQVCKSFSNEQRDIERFRLTTKKVYRVGRTKAIISSVLAGINSLFSNASTAVTVWVGFVVLAHTSGELNVVASFLLYTLSLNKTMNALSKLLLKISNNSASIQRILQMTNYKPHQPKKEPEQLMFASSQEQDTPIRQELTISPSTIEFRRVSFQYSEKRGRVLNNLDLKVQSGQYLGVIGASGSGKSTILKLILGLYAPTQGEIVCSFDRKRIAYVPQEAVIFSGSIRENIDYSSKGLTDTKLTAICKDAGIFELIMSLPDKFQTRVGCKGVKLSGGQKQRICLARALSIKPRLLLLDEATASLDNKSEQLVCRTVSDISRKRKITIIFISHRFRRSSDFSRILMLKDGQIDAVGSHHNLMKEHPGYRKLYEMQYS